MKIFKSIKWRLQIWYGLILVAVLAGFGFTAYQLERGRQMRRVDDELHRRFNVLAEALRGPPRRLGVDQPPFGGPPPDQVPRDLPRQNPRPPTEFHLPPQANGLFETNDPNGFYFAIKARDGKEIAHAGNVPSLANGVVRLVAKTVVANAPPELRPKPNPPKPPEYSGATRYFDAEGRVQNGPIQLFRNGAPLPRMVGNFRELEMMMPPGETILVGCSIAPEVKELRLTALKLTGVGAIILFLGLAGGGWLVSRAVKPIEDISTTAAKISAGDLSQRINVAEAESELGQLAAVLNSTFARLDAAFAQQKQFASDAAHELRTPVSVILTQTQTSLNREREAAQYRETVEACQRAAQRMRRLIGALLELARLDAGQEQMKRLRFDFSRTVADGVEMVKPLAEESGIMMFTELSPLEITGDPESSRKSP